ncbi:MAG: ABC transporter ATP-binding protein [Candidatus Thermoplasmatota archaeon]|nr:ABC transporter ATP-binding protein [Candidatus Thermoplasmatota archaeon]
MMTNGKPLIEAKNMSKSYQMGEVIVHALKDVTLKVFPNQITVILGPSGCGKTTLLNQIGGIDSPSGGKLLIEGEEIQNLSQKALTRYRQSKIGFVFQFFNLIPNLTARENIEFVLEYVMNRPSREVRKRTDSLLAQVGLKGREDHYPFQLSGGEQQRVSIARALSKDPKILLADEPTGELDYTTGKMILALLSSFANNGRGVLLVTHNKELAKIAHHVAYLRDGSVVEEKRNPRPMDIRELEW